jgi:membrane protein YdbS with pleckstrin-like domain
MAFDWRATLLRWVKVEASPALPAGNPASVRVFRAGANEWKRQLVLWAGQQLGALVGLLFFTAVLWRVEGATLRRNAEANPVPAASQNATSEVVSESNRNLERLEERLAERAAKLPPEAFSLAWGFKLLGFLVFAVQLPITLGLRRLEWELRWYVVTDRSLRIRSGIVKLQEQTMSFANVQQVEVRQGPLQRLLGLADVRVQTAGGGSSPQKPGQHSESMHVGYFHAVTNAGAIRDLILDRLREYRESGLGDQEETLRQSSPSAEAWRALREEVTALRLQLEGPTE